jgi:hypothetical protein
LGTGKYSTAEQSQSMMIHDNIINNPKCIPNSFSTYFLTIVERMNINNTKNSSVKIQYSTWLEAIPRTPSCAYDSKLNHKYN